MKYLVKFWDKHEMIVSEKIGKQIQLAKEGKDKNGNSIIVDRIYIGESQYELKAISYVEALKPERYQPLQLQAPNNPVKKETLERLKKEMAARFNWK